jgi:hypothetical protein
MAVTLTSIVCADGAVFQMTNEELKCSKFLSGIVGELMLVSRINVDRVTPDTMASIHQFMNLAVNPPDENWLDSYLEEVRPLWGPILEAAVYLEIELLADRISELIAAQIQQCSTIESVILNSNSRCVKCSELLMTSPRKSKPR